MAGKTEKSGGGIFSLEYEALFRKRWTPWTAGILLGAINIMMFAYAKPWGVAEGLQNWGNWILLGVGVPVGDQAPPWHFTTSVTSLALVFGAFVAALISKEFSLRFTNRRDLARTLIGGILLGIGSVLGIGCTIGGFFSAFSALSLAGPLFMVGLFAGAYLGLKVLMWDLARETAKSSNGKQWGPGWANAQPYIGWGLAALFIVYLFMDTATFSYSGIEGKRGMLVLFGLMLGVVSQRARFCFVRAFREPFMTGDGSMAKGVVLALMVGIAGFAIIKGTELSDYRPVDEYINPSVFLGSLSGGLIFGIGMVLVGGCASGSLWRVGEGQMKFVLALIMFAITNSALTFTLRVTEARQAWGDKAVFLPDMTGWSWALLILFGITIAWYFLVVWNERTEKLVID